MTRNVKFHTSVDERCVSTEQFNNYGVKDLLRFPAWEKILNAHCVQTCSFAQKCKYDH